MKESSARVAQIRTVAALARRMNSSQCWCRMSRSNWGVHSPDRRTLVFPSLLSRTARLMCRWSVGSLPLNTRRVREGLWTRAVPRSSATRPERVPRALRPGCDAVALEEPPASRLFPETGQCRLVDDLIRVFLPENCKNFEFTGVGGTRQCAGHSTRERLDGLGRQVVCAWRTTHEMARVGLVQVARHGAEAPGATLRTVTIWVCSTVLPLLATKSTTSENPLDECPGFLRVPSSTHAPLLCVHGPDTVTSARALLALS